MPIMLCVALYAECHYAECHYAECRGTIPIVKAPLHVATNIRLG